MSKAVYGTSRNFLVLIVVDISCVMRWTILKGSRGSGPEQGAGGTQAGLMVIIFCVSAFMESKHCVRTSPGCCRVEADHKMTDMFWSCNLHQHHLHLYTLISGIFVCLEHAKPIYTLSIMIQIADIYQVLQLYLYLGKLRVINIASLEMALSSWCLAQIFWKLMHPRPSNFPKHIMFYNMILRNF